MSATKVHKSTTELGDGGHAGQVRCSGKHRSSWRDKVTRAVCSAADTPGVKKELTFDTAENPTAPTTSKATLAGDVMEGGPIHEERHRAILKTSVSKKWATEGDGDAAI